MRFLAALSALCFLATTSLLTAEVQVTAQTQRSGFLLYERVDLYVTVTNTGATDLVLNNSDRPWLSFLITKHNGLPVRPERKSTFNTVNLKAGESKTLKINLTPLFAFREEGNYTAAAVVNLPGEGDVVSDSVPFSVLKGKEVWSSTRPVAGTDRVYSLIRFAPEPQKTDLYLRVEVPGDNMILANLSLGEVVAYIDPEVYFDPQGNIHVMQPIAMSTYLYTRADSEGKVVHQGIFKTFQAIRPRLTKLNDGNVVVAGGLEENPNMPRETLSHGQRKASTEVPTAPDSTSTPAIPSTTPPVTTPGATPMDAPSTTPANAPASTP